MDFNFTQILTVGIIFWACYKVIETFAHRKERIKLVEKMDLAQDSKTNLAQILGEDSGYKNWATRLGSLLIGLGIGVLVAYLICYASGMYMINTDIVNGSCIIDEQSSVIYGSCTLLFGGLGLLASYFLEKRQNK